jgi:hypothetical protein
MVRVVHGASFNLECRNPLSKRIRLSLCGIVGKGALRSGFWITGLPCRPSVGFQKITKASQERESEIKNELEVVLDFNTGNE